MNIHVLMMGRSYDAGDDLPDMIELPDAATIDDALTAIRQLLPDQHLPGSCLIVRSGKHLGTATEHENATLADGDELMLIAPVAGG